MPPRKTSSSKPARRKRAPLTKEGKRLRAASGILERATKSSASRGDRGGARSSRLANIAVRAQLMRKGGGRRSG